MRTEYKVSLSLISSSLGGSSCFVVYGFQFFTDLAQTHRCVWKNLVFRDLLLNDLGEDDLERKAKTTFFQVLFKHEGLLLAFS